MLSTRVSCFCANHVLVISNEVGTELENTVGYKKKIDTIYEPVEYQRFAEINNGSLQHNSNAHVNHSQNKIDIVYTPVSDDFF